MKNLILILLLCGLWSCGSRKVDKTAAAENRTEKVSTQSQTNAEKTAESSGSATVKIESDFLNFDIEPQNGLPAVFSFQYAGKTIEGTTTGKMNFTSEKKQAETKTRWQEKVHTTYVTHTNYQTHTTYKTRITEKHSDKKAYPWWQLAIGAVLLWELLKILIKKLLPFNVLFK